MLSFSGATPKDLIATAYFAHSVDIVQKAAAALGKLHASNRHRQLLQRIRHAFVNEFVTDEGQIAGGTQSAYVLALDFDLLPEALRPAAASRLAADITELGHLTTGFLGTPHLLQVLTRFGYLDLAYQLLTREEFPSWLYPITRGATTIWERWDGIRTDGSLQDPAMNSFNHYAYGSVGEWMYSVMGGIAIDPSAPGYRRVLIRPQPGGGLTHVAASHESMYGWIRCSWTIECDAIAISLEMPPNSCATVYLPDARIGQVTESDLSIMDSVGIANILQGASDVRLDVSSENYCFRYPLNSGHL